MPTFLHTAVTLLACSGVRTSGSGGSSTVRAGSDLIFFLPRAGIRSLCLSLCRSVALCVCVCAERLGAL